MGVGLNVYSAYGGSYHVQLFFFPLLLCFPFPLGIKTAQKPYIVWSLAPKGLIYESLDP